ncbi:TIGR02206 family membrane protein [Corynebacterium breve]|uniref:TIGR02206 family membrane protein n=1 Tax=Corynebacterium breve TaxID=3049799 RepID=A0ABY8VE37_9CORY|nr:TIGR02206 family membrane protein [Corynebacterium breve]WIM67602.1 TIGR02206 family membrane protein [Corynebacterium breve]
MPFQPQPWTSRHTGKTYPTITQFDRTHLAAVVLVIIVSGILVVTVKRLPKSVVKSARMVAGAIMGILVVAYYSYVLHPSRIVWDETAPFHVSDCLRVITPLAVATGNPTATGLSYYWGTLLNSMALLTPDMAYVLDRPRLQELAYWYFHAVALVAPVVLTFGLGYRPSWRDWRITCGISVVWAVFSANMNKRTGGNYSFLAGKPRGVSILDFFGPWPVYLIILSPVVGAIWAAMTWVWPQNRR